MVMENHYDNDKGLGSLSDSYELERDEASVAIYRFCRNLIATGFSIKDLPWVLYEVKKHFKSLLEEPEWDQTS